MLSASSARRLRSRKPPPPTAPRQRRRRAPAGGAGRDQGRRRPRRHTTPFGCGGDTAGHGGRRGGAAPARRRRDRDRQDPRTRGRPMAVHRVPDLRRDPQSLEHRPHARRLKRGAAAAVAAGLVAGAIGSDGAGSVRIPAAWTGLVGLKPQRGRISTWPDPEAFNGLTCFGPLTRSVADAALLLDAVAGNREGDLHRPPPRRELRGGGLAGAAAPASRPLLRDSVWRPGKSTQRCEPPRSGPRSDSPSWAIDVVVPIPATGWSAWGSSRAEWEECTPGCATACPTTLLWSRARASMAASADCSAAHRWRRRGRRSRRWRGGSVASSSASTSS